tara:strand:+ start:2893 stop:3060 length:168 start_codon:yes stop_codon:yes gene_type:complete
MKVGDIVWENYPHGRRAIAVVLYVNEEGGTIKALLSTGEIGWLVKSGCEVINESR